MSFEVRLSSRMDAFNIQENEQPTSNNEIAEQNDVLKSQDSPNDQADVSLKCLWLG